MEKLSHCYKYVEIAIRGHIDAIYEAMDVEEENIIDNIFHILPLITFYYVKFVGSAPEYTKKLVEIHQKLIPKVQPDKEYYIDDDREKYSKPIKGEKLRELLEKNMKMLEELLKK